MGTMLSIAAIAAALVLLAMPFGLHFYVLLAMFALLAAAAFTRPRPAVFLSGAFIVGFSALGAAPFEAPRRFLNGFRRTARGEGAEAEAAQSTLDFYEMLSGLVWPLEIALIVIVLALVAVATRREGNGAFNFLMNGSDGIGDAMTRVGKLASLLFLPMIIIIFYDVVQRKYIEFAPGFADSWMFQTFTSTKLQEMQWHLHAVLFLMCFGFGYLQDAHVRIELVRERLRPRTRVWIELLGCTFFLIPYCFLVYVYGFDFARKSFDIGEVSSALTGLPYRFIIKGFLPIGFTVLGLAAFSVWLKCFVYLFGPDNLKDRSSYYAGTQHTAVLEDAPLDAAR